MPPLSIRSLNSCWTLFASTIFPTTRSIAINIAPKGNAAFSPIIAALSFIVAKRKSTILPFDVISIGIAFARKLTIAAFCSSKNAFCARRTLAVNPAIETAALIASVSMPRTNPIKDCSKAFRSFSESFKPGPNTSSKLRARLPTLLIIRSTWPDTVLAISFAALAAAPAESAWFSRFLLNVFSLPLVRGRIAAIASTLPNSFVISTSLPPVFSTTSSKNPPNPFALIAAEEKSMPRFFAASCASFVGLITLAITCRKPAKVDSIGKPCAVTVEIAAFSSSIPTPAAAAIGATRPICCAYCATTILPSFCVCINPSTSFAALSELSP